MFNLEAKLVLQVVVLLKLMSRGEKWSGEDWGRLDEIKRDLENQEATTEHLEKLEKEKRDLQKALSRATVKGAAGRKFFTPLNSLAGEESEEKDSAEFKQPVGLKRVGDY